MKRAIPRISMIIPMLVLICLVTGVWTVAAQQAPPQPAVQGACPHALKAGVPFAWLRYEPSSFSGFGFTLRPDVIVSLNDPAVLSWDGVQWWAYILPNAAPARGYYWVELNSLEARCQPATPTPGSGAAPWASGNTVRVRLNVQFVWFRGSPAPGSPPIHTVLPGTQLVIVQGASVDTFNQWWWLMRDPRNGVTGWVEQNTVELLTGGGGVTPVPPADWRLGDFVRVRANVPFSWIRFSPSSVSGIVFTVRTGQQLIVQGGRQFDGVQYWWNVIVPNSTAVGWVEENSLEFVRRN